MCLVGRPPVWLFGRLLLDIVDRRAGNPSFGQRLGGLISLLDLDRIEERVIRPIIDAECPHAFRDAACDCTEG